VVQVVYQQMDTSQGTISSITFNIFCKRLYGVYVSYPSTSIKPGWVAFRVKIKDMAGNVLWTHPWKQCLDADFIDTPPFSGRFQVTIECAANGSWQKLITIGVVFE